MNSDVDENIDELKKVRSCLNTLKSKVDKLDVDQLKTASVDLINIIDVVDKGIVKKNVNDELVKQSNAFDSNEIIKKQYNAKLQYIENKIPTDSDLVNGKIPNVMDLDKKKSW